MKCFLMSVDAKYDYEIVQRSAHIYDISKRVVEYYKICVFRNINKRARLSTYHVL